MTRRPRNTARRSWEALQAETRARRQDAATILREAWERKKARPGYIGEQTRNVVEELIREVDEP